MNDYDGTGITNRALVQNNIDAKRIAKLVERLKAEVIEADECIELMVQDAIERDRQLTIAREALEQTKPILSAVARSRKGSIGSLENTYIAQLDVATVDRVAIVVREALENPEVKG